MSYEDVERVPFELFNVRALLPLREVNRIYQEVSMSKDFHRFEVLKDLVTQGTWWMHRPEVRAEFEKVCTEYADVWQRCNAATNRLVQKALEAL